MNLNVNKNVMYLLAFFGVSTALMAPINNLGVDQPNPNAKMHITNTENQNSLQVDDEANDATPFVVDSLGKVGVGVPNPVEKLEVDGNIKANGNVLDQNGFVNPTGVVQAYVGATAPQGWLVCDGSAVSRTTYANLFAIIGTSFGIGDGSTTFNLPDMRGQFIRGWDNGANNDPDAANRTATNSGATGDAIGSTQNDATDVNGVVVNSSSSATTDGNHHHHHGLGTYPSISTRYGMDNIATLTTMNDYGAQTGGTTAAFGQSVNSNTTGAHTHTVTTTTSISSSDTETRPINIYMNYIIKY